VGERLMPYPAADLFPSSTTFPGSLPVLALVDDMPSIVEVTLAGMPLNGTDDTGCSWLFETLDGWHGSPGSSLSLTQKDRAPGAWVSPRQLTPRTVTLGGSVVAPTIATLRAAMDRLNAAVSIDARLLTVTEDGLTRSLIVYRGDDVLWLRVSPTEANWSAQVTAADPRKFGQSVTTRTALPSVSGGLTIPFTIPFAIATDLVSGVAAAENEGNATGPVTLRIDGPVTGAQVTHNGTEVLGVSLAVAAGQWLEVRMEERLVRLNGEAPRNSWVTDRGWSGFDPGMNSWAFTATSGSGLLTVTATPAWL
jgi:hypothetical protein